MHPVRRSLLVVSCAGLLCGQTMVDLRTQSKSVDFSGANATKPFKSGTVFPSACAVGEMFFKTDAAAGSNLYGCTSLNAWTLQQNTQIGVPSVTGNSGKVLSTDGTNPIWSVLAGDVNGAVTAATVTQIQGRPVSSAAPGSGQALAWNATTSRWEPQTVSGGGGGTGATMASQLGDFVVTRSNATTLTIGAGCSVSTPCNVRFGSLVYSVPGGGTATVAGGSGLAYIYVSSAGVLTVGHNLTVNCTAGCTAQSGITSFPADAVPLFIWSATAGAWDSAGGTDERALLGTKSVAPGAGLTSVETSGKTIISPDPAVISLRTAVPGTSSTPCTAGAWATDSTYYYLCTSTNSWRRVALATF